MANSFKALNKYKNSGLDLVLPGTVKMLMNDTAVMNSESTNIDIEGLQNTCVTPNTNGQQNKIFLFNVYSKL